MQAIDALDKIEKELNELKGQGGGAPVEEEKEVNYEEEIDKLQLEDAEITAKYPNLKKELDKLDGAEVEETKKKIDRLTR